MKPTNCISVEEAKKLQEIWTNSRGKEIRRGPGYEDIREFQVKASELQEYLDYVKRKSEEQGISDPGIRIYFGAYPDQKDRKSFTTISLAPTEGIEKGDSTNEEVDEANNYEIEPLNNNQGGNPSKVY